MRALPNVRLLAVDRNPNPELTSTQSSAHLFAVELADLVTMGGENGLPGPFVRYSFPARLRYPTAGNRSGHVETELPAPTVYMSQSAGSDFLSAGWYENYRLIFSPDAACREMAGDFDEAMIPPPLSHGAAESIVESGDGLCQSAPSASLESVVVVNVPVGGSQDLLVVLIVTSLCQVMLAAAVAQQLWQLNTLSRQNKE